MKPTGQAIDIAREHVAWCMRRGQSPREIIASVLPPYGVDYLLHSCLKAGQAETVIARAWMAIQAGEARLAA